jgi:hypothetical protein
VVAELIQPPKADEIVAAWGSAYRDRAGQEPTSRAVRQLAREASRLLAERRPVAVVRDAALLLVREAAGPRLLEGRVDRLLMDPGAWTGGRGSSLNPVDARILNSVRRAVGEVG